MTVNIDQSATLLEVLRAVTGDPDLAYAAEPRSLSGGFWAELLAFSLANPPAGWPGELVARIMPEARTARKETIIQAAVAAAGFPTPVVRASGRDCRLGPAFLIMDRVAGVHLLTGLTGAGAIASVATAMRELPGVLATTMAGLHSLDPAPVRAQLGSSGDIPVTVPEMLARFRAMARDCGRADLTAAAQWLIDSPLPAAPEVICHGDLHPFNVLVDGAHVCLIDWSSALLAPRPCDVGFTSLVLAEPPLAVPRAARPLLRRAGAWLARRFVARYEQESGVRIDSRELQWYQGFSCLRALVEAAGWSRLGIAEARADHPWLVSGPAFARRLTALTGSRVRAAS